MFRRISNGYIIAPNEKPNLIRSLIFTSITKPLNMKNIVLFLCLSASTLSAQLTEDFKLSKSYDDNDLKTTYLDIPKMIDCYTTDNFIIEFEQFKVDGKLDLVLGQPYQDTVYFQQELSGKNQNRVEIDLSNLPLPAKGEHYQVILRQGAKEQRLFEFRIKDR